VRAADEQDFDAFVVLQRSELAVLTSSPGAVAASPGPSGGREAWDVGEGRACAQAR
jgi:hypothetical protein